MKRLVQVVLLLLSGVGLLRTSLFTEEYLRYVKPGMRPLLVAAGVVLVVLGAVEAWTAVRRRRADDRQEHQGHQEHQEHQEHQDRVEHHQHPDHQEHGHDHSRVPRVAWLLFLPVLSLLFYAPPALGSYTASREPAKAVATVDDDGFDPLPATSPLPITLTDFTQRVQQDRSLAVKGRAVQLTGFASPAGDSADGWYLTRILVSCCAADATTLKVRMYGVAAPEADTWVAVTGVWHAGGKLGTSSAPVALDVRSVQKIRKPTNAYMDALPLG
ncbi:TIGR03943 family protein [Streptomyces sp. NPDC000618]|uniref:TIGR03943 family putative permease subunit n=1 Tax=Streptomyces sp. NPDC000618 TaxID=3154265 RepID=UPI00332E07D6